MKSLFTIILLFISNLCIAEENWYIILHSNDKELIIPAERDKGGVHSKIYLTKPIKFDAITIYLRKDDNVVSQKLISGKHIDFEFDKIQGWFYPRIYPQFPVDFSKFAELIYGEK